MRNVIEIIFEDYCYIENNSDGIDSDRYTITFSLREIKGPHNMGKITKHKIIVSISGRTLASDRLWNFDRNDILKIVYLHACEYIKASVIDGNIGNVLKLNLDERRLAQHQLDVYNIQDIKNFRCTVDIDKIKSQEFI